MLQLWVIALVAGVYLHDELGTAGSRAGMRTAVPGSVSLQAVFLALFPYVLVAVMTHLVCAASGRAMDRRGSLGAVSAAERMLMASRLAGVAIFMFGVFSLGWIEQVRAVVGDLVLVDELVALSPPLLMFAAGWWSFYPIERRLREVVWVRVLEEGQPAYPTPTRWQFVWSGVRHQMLLILVPLMIMLGVTEGLDRAAAAIRVHRHSDGLLGSVGQWAAARPWLADHALDAIRLGAVICVLVVTPLFLRFLWDAIPLGPGELRDRLMGVCTRAGVRVRELLVWRTHGTMLNGLAMGIVAPLRYIMLTDALLDSLTKRQVEGVMAHEVAHAKHHHIAWMVMGIMALGGVVKAGMIVGLVGAAMLLQAVPEMGGGGGGGGGGGRVRWLCLGRRSRALLRLVRSW